MSIATRLRTAALAALAIPLLGQAAPPRYAAGQVWEYRTRSQDTGSLLKIQRVGTYGGAPVYHLSVAGAHFARPGMAGILPHIPVSAATLDASVTRPGRGRVAWPTTAVDEGITEWQRAEGGVFTIPVAQIVNVVDQQTAPAGDPPSA